MPNISLFQFPQSLFRKEFPDKSRSPGPFQDPYRDVVSTEARSAFVFSLNFQRAIQFRGSEGDLLDLLGRSVYDRKEIESYQSGNFLQEVRYEDHLEALVPGHSVHIARIHPSER